MAKFRQQTIAKKRREIKRVLNGNYVDGRYYNDYSLGCMCFQSGKLPPKNASKAFGEGWRAERDREIKFFLQVGSEGSRKRLAAVGIVLDADMAA